MNERKALRGGATPGLAGGWRLATALVGIGLSWPAAGGDATAVPGRPPVALTAQPASAASAAVSAHILAARQHALAASGPVALHSVPPSQRRTRQPIGQQVRHW